MKQNATRCAIPEPRDFLLRYPIIPLIVSVLLCACGNFLFHAAAKGIDLAAALSAFLDGLLARTRDYGTDDGRFALYMAGLVQTAALASALVACLLSFAGRLSRASIPMALLTLIALPSVILANTGMAERAFFTALPFAGLYLAILVASTVLSFAVEKPFLARTLSRILGRIDSLDADTLTGYAFSRFGYDGLERLVKASRNEEFFVKLLSCDDGRYSGLPAAVKARRIELKEAAKAKPVPKPERVESAKPVAAETSTETLLARAEASERENALRKKYHYTILQLERLAQTVQPPVWAGERGLIMDIVTLLDDNHSQDTGGTSLDENGNRLEDVAFMSPSELSRRTRALSWTVRSEYDQDSDTFRHYPIIVYHTTDNGVYAWSYEG